MPACFETFSQGWIEGVPLLHWLGKRFLPSTLRPGYGRLLKDDAI